MCIIFFAVCLHINARASTSFQHVIVVVQENRTPDNLFQGLCANASVRIGTLT